MTDSIADRVEGTGGDGPGPGEIPDLVTELVDMSREYVRQETIEPAKQLGRRAGFGMAAGATFALAALFGGLGLYSGLVAVLPEGEWYVVLARGITFLAAAVVAGVVAWRMGSP